jgi:hypothetical protein
VNRSKALSAAAYAALQGVPLSPIARADWWNSKTRMSFSGPVQIEGVYVVWDLSGGAQSAVRRARELPIKG